MRPWHPIDRAPFNQTIELKGPGWIGTGTITETSMNLDEMETTGEPTVRCGRQHITHWRPVEEPEQ